MADPKLDSKGSADFKALYQSVAHELSISQRLSAFDLTGDLPRYARKALDLLEKDQDAIALAFWEHYSRIANLAEKGRDLETLKQRHVESSRIYTREKMANLGGQTWVEMAFTHALSASKLGVPMWQLLAANAHTHDFAIERMRARLNDDMDHFLPLARATAQVMVIEAEIMSFAINAMTHREAQMVRTAQTASFKQTVDGELQQASHLGTGLKSQVVNASEAARRCLAVRPRLPPPPNNPPSPCARRHRPLPG